MAARLVQVILINSSDFPVVLTNSQRPHGFWQEPWGPVYFTTILQKHQNHAWRLESGGVMTGVEGELTFKVDVPAAFGQSRSEGFRLHFERPYIGHFARTVEYFHHDPTMAGHDHYPTMAYVKDQGFSDIANMDSSPFEFLAAAAAPFGAGNAPLFLANDASAKHVSWYLEVLNAGQSSSLTLRAAVQGVIYAVADNGDLLWYRHTGRDDGSFEWAANEGKKVGHGWNAKQVFADGDGAIYALMANGDLMWFRHTGREDGSFDWAANEGKKVGNGWNAKQVFSGGGGVIYALMENGDLLWYRHDGRQDGSFAWASNQGRKVGSGWNASQVFSGGDGIIYALMVNGDLLWYRHTGREDGSFAWASNEGRKVGHGWNARQVFSGGNGIIYALMHNGDLLWYHHTGREDGSFAWASNQGKKVGNGWNVKQVFAG